MLSLLAGLIAMGVLSRAHRGGDGVSGGTAGTVIDVSPLSGDTAVSVSPGQVVRIHLPGDWIWDTSAGHLGDPFFDALDIQGAAYPLRRAGSRGERADVGGGFTFMATAAGTKRLVFSKAGAAPLQVTISAA